jgi:hypothetical protein
VNAPAQPAASAGTDQTANWSGYAVQAFSEFTKVVGTWVQPAANCTQTTGETLAAFWVGLDGYKNQTVEQIGTKITCTSGSPSYTAWWQMYPAPKVTLSTSTYPVQPGDTLSASVTRSGTSYALVLQSSEGWSYSTEQVGSGANTSAEWIASSPPLCPTCRFADLTDFGTVMFSRAQAAVGKKMRPISSFVHKGGPQEITMATGGIIRAQPGPLNSNGEDFSVSWTHS